MWRGRVRAPIEFASGGAAAGTTLLVVEQIVVGEALDAQHLRRLEEDGEQVLRDVHLALVHELQHRLQLAEVDVGENDDRMRVVDVEQHLLEEGAARGEHRLVGA